MRGTGYLDSSNGVQLGLSNERFHSACREAISLVRTSCLRRHLHTGLCGCEDCAVELQPRLVTNPMEPRLRHCPCWPQHMRELKDSSLALAREDQCMMKATSQGKAVGICFFVGSSARVFVPRPCTERLWHHSCVSAPPLARSSRSSRLQGGSHGRLRWLA